MSDDYLDDVKAENEQYESQLMKPVGEAKSVSVYNLETDNNPILIRKFRWTLEADGLPPHFMESVKFDYVNQRVSFSILETTAHNPLKWIENPIEPLIFTNYSAQGDEIQKTEFFGLQVTKCESSYDYKSTEVAKLDTAVKYGRMQQKTPTHE